MRIIFVGLHNKPHLTPLCGSTKTGKLINRVIKALDTDIEIVKTNLFEVEYMPRRGEFAILKDEWYWSHLPTDDDIIVLLGAMTHKEFDWEGVINVIKVAHPASKRSHIEMDSYVVDTVEKINSLTSPTTK